MPVLLFQGRNLKPAQSLGQGFPQSKMDTGELARAESPETKEERPLFPGRAPKRRAGALAEGTPEERPAEAGEDANLASRADLDRIEESLSKRRAVVVGEERKALPPEVVLAPSAKLYDDYLQTLRELQTTKRGLLEASARVRELQSSLGATVTSAVTREQVDALERSINETFDSVEATIRRILERSNYIQSLAEQFGIQNLSLATPEDVVNYSGVYAWQQMVSAANAQPDGAGKRDAIDQVAETELKFYDDLGTTLETLERLDIKNADAYRASIADNNKRKELVEQAKVLARRYVLPEERSVEMAAT